MKRYGKNIKVKYAIDFGVGIWSVFNQITDKVIKYFPTRQEARDYLRKIQKVI